MDLPRAGEAEECSASVRGLVELWESYPTSVCHMEFVGGCGGVYYEREGVEGAGSPPLGRGSCDRRGRGAMVARCPTTVGCASGNW